MLYIFLAVKSFRKELWFETKTRRAFVNITPEVAIREYGTLTLRSELVSRAVFENRAVRGFLGAVPDGVRVVASLTELLPARR